MNIIILPLMLICSYCYSFDVTIEKDLPIGSYVGLTYSKDDNGKTIPEVFGTIRSVAIMPPVNNHDPVMTNEQIINVIVKRLVESVVVASSDEMQRNKIFWTRGVITFENGNGRNIDLYTTCIVIDGYKFDTIKNK